MKDIRHPGTSTPPGRARPTLLIGTPRIVIVVETPLPAPVRRLLEGHGAGRGPGWQRAAGVDLKNPGGGYTSRTFSREPSRVKESRSSAISLGNKGRSDLSVGIRVFHQKFGYGEIAEIEGNKLEIDFEKAGTKKVMESFVEPA